jgi:hypothetical protein
MRHAVKFILAFQLAEVCFAGDSIGILFDFATQPEPAVVDLMKSEIRGILAPAQLDLSIQRLGENGAGQPFRKIVVVRFQGACKAQVDSGGIQLEQPELLDSPALGRTSIASGHILPYVQVYCNEVRAFVPSVSRTPFAKMYGRALGRVVVHELYHALLSTREHSRTGIARVSQSAKDLTCDNLALDAGSIERLRELYGTKEKEGDSAESPSHDPELPKSGSRLEDETQSQL